MDMARRRSTDCLSGHTLDYLFRISKEPHVPGAPEYLPCLLHLSNSLLAANISKVSVPKISAEKNRSLIFG